MNYLSLYNFKVFKKVEEFNLAPITFLTGMNNSGKSSVLKSILLLSDFLNSENDQTILNFNGAFSSKHKINCFGNAKSWKAKDKYFSFHFEHDRYRFEFSFSGQQNDDTAILDTFCMEALEINERLSLKWLSEKSYDLTLSQRFFDFIARRQQMNLFNEEDLIKQVDELKAQIKKIDSEKRKNENNKDVIIEILSEKQRLKTRLNLLSKQIKTENSDSVKIGGIYQTTVLIDDDDFGNASLATIIRKGLSKYFDRGKTGQVDTEFRALFRFYDILRMRLNLAAEHLSPNRFYQSRLYFKQNYTSEINEVLFKYAIDKPKPSSQAARFLEKWLSAFGFGEGIKVEIIEGNSCKVEILKNGSLVNIADMGFGPGQLLTMLLSLADIINKKTSYKNRHQRPQIGRNNIVLIEEPEANLHPSFQSKLLELFFEVSKEYGISIIIETHSEYLIRSSQVKVKELGKDHPFRIYYFDSEKGPHEMKYREDGTFEKSFGPGFMDVASNLTFDLL